jgi:hypothetical protein
MLVDLDSRDLISLERDAALADALREALVSTGSRLILSETVLDEIIEPLRRRAERSTVMTLLNLLESLPHVWIRTVDLEAREIERGVQCFLANEGYRPVDPFLASFVDTLLHLQSDSAAYRRLRWRLSCGSCCMPRAPCLPVRRSGHATLPWFSGIEASSAHSGHREQPDRSMVNAPIGDRDRSGATLGVRG